MPHPIFEKLDQLKDYEPQTFDAGERRKAAVLVPLIRRNETQIIYTLRAAHLNKHAGQISFPGGAIEPGEDAWTAALREAQEEIGMEPEHVRFLGEIDNCYSPRGYHIRCFVGLVEHFEPKLDCNEVERLVEASMTELFDESLHRTEPWKTRLVHYFDFADGLVWGVTGHITWRLRDILKDL